MSLQPYFFAFMGCLLFAGASTRFARYSTQVSSLWMNSLKATIATSFFLLASGGVWAWRMSHGDVLWTLSAVSAGVFLLSGALGLGVGDIFLLRAFSAMGSARTLMIFSFQPMVMAFLGWATLGQAVGFRHLIALGFFIACTLVVSYERFRAAGKWETQGILFALVGMLLDNTGVVLTRYAFEHSPKLSAFEGNAVRGMGAVLFFVALKPRYFTYLKWGWNLLSRVERRSAALSAVYGSGLSLSFWLAAIQTGHLATLSGFGGVTPVLAALFECYQARQWPSRYLMLAMALFVAGFIQIAAVS